MLFWCLPCSQLIPPPPALFIKWLHAAFFARHSWHPWNWLLFHRSHIWCNLTAFFICLCPKASLPLLMKYINLAFSCCVGFLCYDLSLLLMAHPCCPCYIIIASCDSNCSLFRPNAHDETSHLKPCPIS